MTDEKVKDKYKNIPAAKDTVQANIPGISELIRRGKEAKDNAEKSKQPEQPILKKDSSKESATPVKPTTK